MTLSERKASPLGVPSLRVRVSRVRGLCVYIYIYTSFAARCREPGDPESGGGGGVRAAAKRTRENAEAPPEQPRGRGCRLDAGKKRKKGEIHGSASSRRQSPRCFRLIDEEEGREKEPAKLAADAASIFSFPLISRHFN